MSLVSARPGWLTFRDLKRRSRAANNAHHCKSFCLMNQVDPRECSIKLQMYSLEKQKVSRLPEKGELLRRPGAEGRSAPRSLPSNTQSCVCFLGFETHFPNTHRSSNTHTTATTDHMFRMSELGGIRVQPPNFSDGFTGALS